MLLMMNRRCLSAARILIGICILFELTSALSAQSPMATELRDTWKPSPALLAEARKMGEGGVTSSWLYEDDEFVPRRVDVLRAGLRLPDGPAALRCAAALSHQYLDAWESARVVELCLPQVFAPDSPVVFDDLRFVMGSDDVPALFRAVVARKEWAEDVGFGKVHVLMRGEHGALGATHLGSENPAVRELSREAVWSAINYSDLHREEISGALLALGGRLPKEDASGGGLPPRLGALLDWIHEPGFEKELEELRLRSLGEGLERWAFRWLAEVTPAAADEPLLLRLFALHPAATDEPGMSESRASRLAVARSLAQLESATSLEALVAANPGSDCIAAYALVRRGEKRWLETLIGSLRRDNFALALLFKLAPETARGLILHALRGKAAEQLAMLDLLERMKFGCLEGGIRVERSALLPLRRALEEAAASDPLMALSFALQIPRCATVAMADVVLDAMGKLEADRYCVSPAWFADEDADEYLEWLSAEQAELCFAFLESARPRRLREQLRAWSAGSPAQTPRVKNFARGVLLRIGDTTASADLLEYARELETEEASPLSFYLAADDLDLALARSTSPAVVDYLRQRLEEGEGSLRALALAQGLPARAGGMASQALDAVEDDEVETRIRSLVIEGDPISALVEALKSLDADEGVGFSGLGTIKDPRVVAWLEKVRAQRHRGLYAAATAELSMMGVPEARAETWTSIRVGRYGWLNNLEEAAATDGYDPQTIPWWISELESQCCRIITGSAIFPDLIDDEINWYAGARNKGMTPYAWALRRWMPNEKRRLVWSDWQRRFLMIDQS
jgi:DNA-binding phage protein